MAKEKTTLTGRQLDVMQILWASEKPLIASEILKRNETLNIHTVQSVLKSLVEKQYIKVADITYSRTVLCRSYIPIITARDYMDQSIPEDVMLNTQTSIVAALIKHEDAENIMDELLQIIEERKNALAQNT